MNMTTTTVNGVFRWLNCRHLSGLLLILIHLLEKRTLADPMTVAKCVPPEDDPGVSFGCSSVPDSMIWIRIGYYGMTQVASPANFCDNTTMINSTRSDCIADPSGDRRVVASQCNTYTNCLTTGKSYSDITGRCPGANGYPYAYVNYECLPRKQSDGVNYISTISTWDSRSYSDFVGKIFFLSPTYPYGLTNKNLQCQVTVGPNTQVTFRVLDIFGRLLDGAGACPYTLYMFSGVTGIYREWCVAKNWTMDFSVPVVFASSTSSQSIDIIFTKTYPGLEAEAAVWILLDAVNVADNSPGTVKTVSLGASFTPQPLYTNITTKTAVAATTTTTTTMQTPAMLSRPTANPTTTTTATTPIPSKMSAIGQTTTTTMTTPTVSKMSTIGQTTTTATTMSIPTKISTMGPKTTTSTMRSTLEAATTTTTTAAINPSPASLSGSDSGGHSSTVDGQATVEGGAIKSGAKSPFDAPTCVIIGVVVAATSVVLSSLSSL